MGISWANQIRLNRLGVDELNDIVAFIDKEAAETVQIVQSQGYTPQSILVNGTPINLSVHPVIKGGLRFTKRNVYHYVTSMHCQALRVGLTVHQSWFSSTPHTFELNPEPGFEEVFYFRSSSPNAKGILEGQGLWYDGAEVDAAWPVRDRQFATVPMGTHRVTVLPVEGKPRSGWWYWWVYLALEDRWEKNR